MVPKGWELNTVADLFDTHLGKMLNQAAKLQTPQYKYLGNSDIKWGNINVLELKTMYFSEKEKTKFTLKIGDILMCEGGEVGRCSIWNSTVSNIYYQKALHRLRSRGDIIPEYFYNYMCFIAGTKTLDNLTTRTSIAHLTQDKLLKIPIKTPPLPEQFKIAKILSVWDKAISTTERLIKNSKQQKKALMQQLLTGKKRLLDESGEPFKGEWEVVTIGSTSKCFSGGTPSRSKEEYYGGDIPWITSGKLNDRFVSSVNEYISELGLNNSSAKVVKNGSLLIAMYGATAGKVAINKLNGATVNQAVLALEPNEKFHDLFLFYLFEVEMVKALKLVQGGQPNLSAAIIKGIKIKHPLLTEQRRIAAILTNTDKEVELLEQQLADFKQEKKALMQQLLTGKRRVKIDNTEAA